MSVSAYLDVNYGGESHTFTDGNYNRDYLRDIYYGNFEGEISSLKIDRNTIVLLSDSSRPTGAGNNRVLIGPQTISDLTTIGFNNKANSIKVRRFREDNWGAGATACVFNNYNYSGGYKNLRAGDYDATRMTAKEDGKNGIADKEIRSITVGANTLLILYDGASFETTSNSVYIEGPANIGDLSKYNLDGQLSSIRIYSVDTPPNLPSNPIHGPPNPRATSSNGYNSHVEPSISKPVGVYGTDYIDPRQVTDSNDPPMSLSGQQLNRGDSQSIINIAKKAKKAKKAADESKDSGDVVIVKVIEPWSDRMTMGVKNGIFVLLFIMIIISAILTSITMIYINRRHENILESK